MTALASNYQSFFASFCSQKEDLKVFFFEKKNQKTFITLLGQIRGHCEPLRSNPSASAGESKMGCFARARNDGFDKIASQILLRPIELAMPE